MTYRPLPVRLSRVVWGIASRARIRQATFVLLALLASLAVATSATAEPPAIAAKRAEAQRVLAEIHSLDVQMEKAIEAYNGATDQLATIERERALNTRELVIARHNVSVSQQRLGARLRALYIEGQDNSTLAILLGSHSIGDFLNQVETVNSVASQDAQVIDEIQRFKRVVTTRAAQLRIAHARQEQVVAQRAAAKRQVEAGLAERQQLLGSIKGEIARLQREEEARQARLAAEARARLQAQLAAQHAAVQQAAAQDVVGASAVSPDGTVTVAPPSQYGGVVGIAMQYLGTPYVWGGSAPGGFDCSGLVMYVYAQMGVSLPHHAADQFNYGVPVSRDQLEPGDLVFFDGLGHVGIYIGNGQFIHAPHTGDVVKISSLNESWYAATYVGARRIT
ncbi:MAG TPA: NlpC/P60 family protein [Gaiellaceae bacterium]|nr:NlpC/P60 family protein [Gaiellaceae bacterium]